MKKRQTEFSAKPKNQLCQNAELAHRYDFLFTQNPAPYGGNQPDYIVKELIKVLKQGRIIELGCGTGRNVLALAAAGFSCEAWDLSPVALNRLGEEAGEMGSRISINCRNILELNDVSFFQAVVSTYVLHHLSWIEACDLLKRLKINSSAGCYHALALFGDEGAFSKHRLDVNSFLPNKSELSDLYAGWEIIRLETDVIQTNEVDDYGKPLINSSISALFKRPCYMSK